MAIIYILVFPQYYIGLLRNGTLDDTWGGGGDGFSSRSKFL